MTEGGRARRATNKLHHLASGSRGHQPCQPSRGVTGSSEQGTATTAQRDKAAAARHSRRAS